MTVPSRSKISDALLRILAEKGGEVSVREADLFHRLAAEVGVTPSDLPVYHLRGGREIPRWEQRIRVLQQEMRRRGLFTREETPRGVWRLSEKGMLHGARLLFGETAAPLSRACIALRNLGFEVLTEKETVTIRSLEFDFLASLVMYEGPAKRTTLPRTGFDLLLIATSRSHEAPPMLPEGAMFLHLEDIEDLALRKALGLEGVIEVFRGWIDFESRAREFGVRDAPSTDVAQAALLILSLLAEERFQGGVSTDMLRGYLWGRAGEGDIDSLLSPALGWLQDPRCQGITVRDERYFPGPAGAVERFLNLREGRSV